VAVDALVVMRHDAPAALPQPLVTDRADPPVLHPAPAALAGAHHSRSER
jgi:hypothetical protein